MKQWFFILLSIVAQGTIVTSPWQPLKNAPAIIDTHKEIVAVYNAHLPEYFNALTPQERVFIYYMFRASLPGNVIASDQIHRDAPKIQKLFEHILEHKNMLLTSEPTEDAPSFDTNQLLKEISLFLAYFWAHHSHYFIEHANAKRTPERLGLSTLTGQNLITALQMSHYPNAAQAVSEIAPSLFDTTFETTLTIPDSIEKSAINFYAPDFTDADFNAIDPEGQRALNAYFYVTTRGDQRVPAYQKYSVYGKYGKELQVTVYWLQKAYDHAQNYPDQFDRHFIKSLEYLIAFLKSGEEQFFKQHSIEWLKSDSKIDYTYGFIETYEDPKDYRAIFQADVTIKSLDIQRLSNILPEIEQQLPFDSAFKRDIQSGKSGAMPNASINVKAFTAGSLGPFNRTLAYCLPNYNEIRSEHGSKQIIYHADKSIGEFLKPELYHRLFNSSDYYQWFQKNDPGYQLMRDIFMLEVILHETLGHGSGRLSNHTFVLGEPLTIEGTTYHVGDVIPVTSGNLPQFLAGYGQTIEELRAEVIALLASIIFFDDFARLGMLNDWPQRIDKDKIIELSIINMVRTALRRLINHSDDASEVTGAHAQANMVIMNYLIEHGAVELVKESVTIADETYTVLDGRIVNKERAVEIITELAQRVQRIKSTGDGLQAKWLVDTYGKRLYQEHMRIMKENMKAVAGEVKLSTMLYPQYIPVHDRNGNLIDIQATWPDSLANQHLLFNKIALKME